MKYILFFIVFIISMPSYADDCFSLVNKNIYKINGNSSVCVKSAKKSNLIVSGFQNTSLFQISNKNNENVHVMFPNELTKVKQNFKITTTSSMLIYRQEGLIVLVDESLAEQIERNSKGIKLPSGGTGTVAGGAIGAIIGNGIGQDTSPINAAIGTGVGFVVGAAVMDATANPNFAATIGGAAGSAVTAALENHKNDPKPPLTVVKPNMTTNKPPVKKPQPSKPQAHKPPAQKPQPIKTKHGGTKTCISCHKQYT